MSTTLQIALFSASIAVALLVLVLIPISLLLYRHAKKIADQLEELNFDLKGLIQDSRTLVQTLNHLFVRTGEQLDEVDKIIGTIRAWLERGSRVIEAASAVVETPLLKTARGIIILRQVWKFMRGVFVGKSRQTRQKIR